MRQRKLQVFLSSTYTDLIDERLAAIEAILAAGHIPAAMEQFSPGDEEAWVKIKRWIDESDAYILILGGRYGSIEPESGKSYVELEYEYALSQNKPFMSIVVTDAAHKRRVNEKGLDVVDERKHQAALKDFKELVTKKHCAFWNDMKDIKNYIFQKLPDWQARPELEGWVRGEEAASSETLNELARLSKENSELREKLSMTIVDFNGLSFEALIKVLCKDKRDRYLQNPDTFLGTSNDFQKKHAFFIPKNVGHLFELTMQQLAGGESHYIVVELPSKDANKGVSMYYSVESLAEYGLVRIRRNERSNNMYSLTDAGMRFKNSLLAYGDRKTRSEDLWNIEVEGLILE